MSKKNIISLPNLHIRRRRNLSFFLRTAPASLARLLVKLPEATEHSSPHYLINKLLPPRLQICFFSPKKIYSFHLLNKKTICHGMGWNSWPQCQQRAAAMRCYCMISSDIAMDWQNLIAFVCSQLNKVELVGRFP